MEECLGHIHWKDPHPFLCFITLRPLCVNGIVNTMFLRCKEEPLAWKDIDLRPIVDTAIVAACQDWTCRVYGLLVTLHFWGASARERPLFNYLIRKLGSVDD